MSGAGADSCPECAWLEGLIRATAVEPRPDPVVDGAVVAPPRRVTGTGSPEEMSGQALREEGRLAEARVQFWHEAADADRRDDPNGLASAGLGLGGMWVHEHRSTVERCRIATLQRRALAGVDAASPMA